MKGHPPIFESLRSAREEEPDRSCGADVGLEAGTDIREGTYGGW